MARAVWPLLSDRPRIEIVLTQSPGARQFTRDILADSGAGSARGPFELILDENDCLWYGNRPIRTVHLGGAYSGWHSVYLVRIRIPALGFDRRVRVVGVS